MEKLIQTEGLGYSYPGSKFTLENISLDIFKGDFISIIGRNGSGKSTLVKLLSGIQFPTLGKVLLNGRNIYDYDRKELSRDLCYLPQTGIMLTDRMTVMDFLLLGRYSYKNFSEFRYSSDDEKVVTESMETAGILEYKDRDITELSGGEKQKVLITLALVQLNLTEDISNKVLIIDEPLTYLDVNYQHEIFHILHKLNTERGLTVIVVMHDLNLALKYTQKTMLLNNGNLVFTGKTSDVINTENLREHFMIESTLISSNNETIINFIPKA